MHSNNDPVSIGAYLWSRGADPATHCLRETHDHYETLHPSNLSIARSALNRCEIVKIHETRPTDRR